MDTSISELVEELKFNTRMQQTDVPYTDEDYLKNVKHGLKQLFIDTQRTSFYNKNAYYDNDGEVFYPYELNATEEEYVLLVSMQAFYKQVASSYMGLMNYSTDALSVQHADKPYENAKHCLEDLESKIRKVYYKMVAYTMPLIID